MSMADSAECGRLLTGAGRDEVYDRYRLLLLRSGGTELLLARSGKRFALPSIDVPRWERPAETLTAAVMNKLGISAYCLFCLNLPPQPAAQQNPRLLYQVMECRDDAATPKGTLWLPARTAGANSFLFPGDREAVNEIVACNQRHGEGPFGKSGWLDDLHGWVQKEIAPLGLSLTGGIRQLNSGPAFALLRLETDGPAVWFKATGEPLRHEPAVTAVLADLFPAFVPRVIAVHPAWNGWLSLEVQGPLLREQRSLSAWTAAARTLADLQIRSLGRTQRLLEAGVRDTRMPRLEAAIDPFLNTIAKLMARQTKVSPEPLNRAQISVLGNQLKHACRQIDQAGMPDTLGHLDFNPGNVITAGNGPVFIDWAEAYVGHPFLTFEYLQAHFRRFSTPEDGSALAASYLGPWRRLFSGRLVDQVRRFTPLLAVFGYAVTCASTNERDTSNPGTDAYLRSLARRMHSEAVHLKTSPYKATDKQTAPIH